MPHTEKQAVGQETIEPNMTERLSTSLRDQQSAAQRRGNFRRKLATWTCGAAAVVLGAVAVAAPITRSYSDDQSVIVTPWGNFTAPEQTMQVLDWLSDNRRMQSVRFNPAHELTAIGIDLEAAPGVELPDGEFTARFIRFNEEGQVVHVEYAAADAPNCMVLVVQDEVNPRRRHFYCVGACLPQNSPCTLTVDLATLEVACSCPH